jgi:hypothetical protein
MMMKKMMVGESKKKILKKNSMRKLKSVRRLNITRLKIFKKEFLIKLKKQMKFYVLMMKIKLFKF